MSGRVKVWKGGTGDVDCLARLHQSEFADPWPADAFRSLIERDGVSVFLAARSESKEAEGLVLIRVIADEAEVLTFCVAQAVRRAGLGIALLDLACRSAFEQGARQVFLEVNEGNEAARSLYARFGFNPVGRRAAYYSQGIGAKDALILKKVLNSAELSQKNEID